MRRIKTLSFHKIIFKSVNEREKHELILRLFSWYCYCEMHFIDARVWELRKSWYCFDNLYIAHVSYELLQICDLCELISVNHLSTPRTLCLCYVFMHNCGDLLNIYLLGGELQVNYTEYSLFSINWPENFIGFMKK